jgi:hypothetical protein
MTEYPKYPEHIKLQAVKNESQIIGEFLEALPQQGLWICEQGGGFYPTDRSIQSMLATYFGIDLRKIDQEKQQMLDQIRRGNALEREMNE